MNKYLKKTIIIGAVSLFLVTGCGNKEIAKLSNGDEVVVELKDNTKISVNDLYNSFSNLFVSSVFAIYNHLQKSK